LPPIAFDQYFGCPQIFVIKSTDFTPVRGRPPCL